MSVSRELRELEAKMTEANATIAKQKMRIKELVKEVRGSTVRAVEVLTAELQRRGK